MTLLTDDRAQSLQVGAVLLFGILVVLFAAWQAFVIPDQNERVELTHNQEVQSEMVELRGAIISTTDASTPGSTSIKLGTQYPTRLLFVNPSPSVGTLEMKTNGPGELTVQNAVAVDEHVRQFWNGTNRTYGTNSLEYTPDYSVFQGAPRTIYGNTVVYNTFDNRNNQSVLSQQTLIDGDTITLVTLEGEYTESDVGSVTPDIQPVSTQSRGVALNSTGGNITLTIPTELNVNRWEELFENEANVLRVSDGNGTVEVELREGQYELRMAKIGTGENAGETPPAYITAVDGAGARVPQDQNHTVAVEVRDAFNVPQSNVALNASVVDESQGEIRPDNRTTDPEGQARFEFDPDESNVSQNDQVQLEFQAANPDAFSDDGIDTLTVNVTMAAASGSGGGGGSGGAVLFDIFWDEARGGDWYDPEKGSGSTCDPSVVDTCAMNNGQGTNNEGDLIVNATTPETGNPVGQVQFALSNDNAGTINTTTGNLSNGQAGVTFVEDGTNGKCRETTIAAYAGGSSDTLDLLVGPPGKCKSDGGGGGTIGSSVAYADDSNGNISFVSSEGETIDTNTTARFLGPVADFTGDGTFEAPAIQSGSSGSGNLVFIRTDGSTQTLDGSGNAGSAGNDLTSMTIGDVDDDGTTEVIYPKNNEIHKANPDGSTQKLSGGFGDGVDAVLAYGQFDNDNNPDLLYADSSQNVKYLSNYSTDGSYDSQVDLSVQIGTSSGIGAGPLADFNDDGDKRLAIVDGSQNVALVDSAGSTENVYNNYQNAAKSQVAAADMDGDGTLEVIHVDGSTRKLQFGSPGSNLSPQDVTDTDGNSVTADKTTGASGTGIGLFG